MDFTNREKDLLLSNAPVLSRITLYDENGEPLQVFNENDYLIDWDYEDYRYVPNQGFIGQFVERLLDGHLMNVPENISLDNKEIEMEIAVVDQLLENQVYHSYGRFMITKIEKEDTTGSYAFESSDYAKKFNLKFDPNKVSYPCTSLELLNNVCEQVGVELNGLGTCGVYIVPEEGLEAGNYCFYYDDLYYEFTLDYDLVYKNVIRVYPGFIGLTSVDNDYNVIREEIIHSEEEEKDDEYEMLNATIVTNCYFYNDDFVIENNQFDDDASCRDVVIAIAKLGYTWARINTNNELCLDFERKLESNINTYDKIDTDKYYETTITGDTLKPVNKVLIGMSNVEGENVYKEQNADMMWFLNIKGKTSQKTLSGKNLFDTSNIEYTNNWNTLDVTFTDGIIKFNGSNNTAGAIVSRFVRNGFVLPAGTYTISWRKVSGSFNSNNHATAIYLRKYATTSSQDIELAATNINSINNGAIIKQFTLLEDTEVSFEIYTNGTIEYDDFIISVQIEKGTTATEFEQYCGGTLSPNPDYPQNINNVTGENTIKMTGKSLLKQADSFNVANPIDLGLSAGEISSRNGMTLVRKEDQSIDVSGRTTGDPSQGVLGVGKIGSQTWNYTNGYILPQGTYKVVWELSNSSNITIGVWKYDKNNAYVGFQQIKANSNTDTNGISTITVDGETATVIGINCPYPNVDITPTNVKLMVIENSETNYDYEPYTEKNYSVNLPFKLGRIGDKFDDLHMIDGVWYLSESIGKIVLDGTENDIRISKTRTNTILFAIINTINDLQNCSRCPNVYSNYFKGVDNYNTDVEGIFVHKNANENNYYIYIGIRKSLASTVEEFRNWLSTHNTIVQYIKDSSLGYAVTIEPLASELHDITRIPLLPTTNHINTETLNEKPLLKVETHNLNGLYVDRYEGESLTIISDDYSDGSQINIYDNPLTYTEELRRIAIGDAERLFGMTYTPMNIQSIGHPWLTGNELMKVTNLENDNLLFYPFDRKITYKGYIETELSSQAKNDTQQKYENPNNIINRMNKTEIIVDKANKQIESIVQSVEETNDKMSRVTQDMDGVTTQIENVNKTVDNNTKDIATIQETIEGLSVETSVTGGTNLIKNSVGYFGNDFWMINDNTEGNIKTLNNIDVKNNSISACALLLQNETVYQKITEIKNGSYYISFRYKRLISNANCKLVINGEEFNLTSDNWKDEGKEIPVTANNIQVSLISNKNDSCLITDLIVSNGTSKISWTQNANETYTDGVKIGKGITITATGSDTELSATASSIDIVNTRNRESTSTFDKYGIKTNSLESKGTIRVADKLIISRVGDQMWISTL